MPLGLVLYRALLGNAAVFGGMSFPADVADSGLAPGAVLAVAIVSVAVTLAAAALPALQAARVPVAQVLHSE